MVTSAEVLIVGAGPTGLTLACDLYRRGVACRLLDRRDGVRRRSRGKGIQSRTLEVFDDLGVAATALAAGRTDHRLRLYAGGALAADLIAPARPARPGVPYPNLLVLPQWRTEELLRERLAALGGAVEPNRELMSFAQDDDGVVATVADPITGVVEPWPCRDSHRLPANARHGPTGRRPGRRRRSPVLRRRDPARSGRAAA